MTAAPHAPHVVIVGGGFGGLDAARALASAPVRVTLVDRHNYHLFQPLLYQVATASLSPGDVASPIRWVLRRQKNVTVLLAEARAIDPEGRRVLLAGQAEASIGYDYLIVAAGAANMALYGKMASVTYEDYPAARLIILWGVNPSASGIHLVPYVREARQRGATLVVIDPRSTQLARSADVHLAVKPGTDVAVAMAIHHYLFSNGHADEAFLSAHTRHADRLRARAAEWTIARAAEVAGIDAGALERVAELYTQSSPALVRCGWGLERNRNGGNAAMAVLSLPAVGGKFGVRGGGYSMSNSASWNIDRPWIGAPDPDTRIINMNRLGRVLLEEKDPPIKVLFV